MLGFVRTRRVVARAGAALQPNPTVNEHRARTRSHSGKALLQRIACATLVFGLCTVATIGRGPTRTSSLADEPSVQDAQAELDAATDARSAVEADLAALRIRFATVQRQLASLSDQQRTTLYQLQSVQANAEQLVVAAYVRGAGPENLTTSFDVERATQSALRKVLTIGRVDQAREAAAKLQVLKAQAEDGVTDLSGKVSRLGADVESVTEDLHRVANRQQTAQFALAAAHAAQAEAEAAALAAAAAAARTSASSVASSRSGSSDSPPADLPRSTPTTSLPSQPSGPGLNRDLANAWARVRDCESGGDYRITSPDGSYRGAYQFDRSTWASVGGSGDPAAAPPEEQDRRAQILYDLVGRGAWPECGRFLP